MVKAGTLDKHGRKIEGVTPAAWDKSYVDYSAQGEEVRGELIATQPPAPAPAAEEKMEVDAPAAAPAAAEVPVAVEAKEEKKETKEEKAARKAAKAEKKRSREGEGEDVSGRSSYQPHRCPCNLKLTVVLPNPFRQTPKKEKKSKKSKTD